MSEQTWAERTGAIERLMTASVEPEKDRVFRTQDS